MKGWFVVALVLLGGWGLHRLASWMELRGWIYYRKSRGSAGSAGNAFLEVQSLFEPGRVHEIEVRREEQLEDDESGAPPASGVKAGA